MGVYLNPVMMNWLLVSCGLLILGIEATLGKHHEEKPPANEKADPNGHSKEVEQEEEPNVEPVNQRAKRFAPYGWPIYPHYNPYAPHPYYAPQVLKKPALVKPALVNHDSAKPVVGTMQKGPLILPAHLLPKIFPTLPVVAKGGAVAGTQTQALFGKDGILQKKNIQKFTGNSGQQGQAGVVDAHGNVQTSQGQKIHRNLGYNPYSFYNPYAPPVVKKPVLPTYVKVPYAFPKGPIKPTGTQKQLVFGPNGIIKSDVGQTLTGNNLVNQAQKTSLVNGQVVSNQDQKGFRDLGVASLIMKVVEIFMDLIPTIKQVLPILSDKVIPLINDLLEALSKTE